MSDMPRPVPGTVGWFDLTVPDAPAVRDFYAKVVGWTAQPLAMGGYEDYVMTAPGGVPVGGVCHARGANADIPPVWIPYVSITDLDASLEACRAGGGTVVAGPRGGGTAGRYAIIRDPAGAVLALHQAGEAQG